MPISAILVSQLQFPCLVSWNPGGQSSSVTSMYTGTVSKGIDIVEVLYNWSIDLEICLESNILVTSKMSSVSAIISFVSLTSNSVLLISFVFTLNSRKEHFL